MTNEFVLWGNKTDNPLDEEVITNTTDTEHLERAKVWAKENGYTTRVQTLLITGHYNPASEIIQAIRQAIRGNNRGN